MAKPSIHTVPAGDAWANRRAGSERKSGVFDTQAEAIAAARETAQREHVEHFIHGQHGQFRDRNSYGHDSRDREG